MKKNQNIKNKELILIVKLSSLGDILHTTPLVNALSKKFEIIYLTFAENAKLLTNNPNVDLILTFHDVFANNKIKATSHNIITLLRIFFLKPKITINLHKIYLLNKLFWIMGIKKRYGIMRDAKDENIAYLTSSIVFNQTEHHIRQYLKFAEFMGYSSNDVNMQFHPDPVVLKSEYCFEFPYLVICPGGGKNNWSTLLNKRWPLNHWIELVKELNNRKIAVILVGGVDDIESAKQIEKNENCRKIINLTNKLNFSDLFNLLSKSLIFIGSDSFLLHFASTTGNYTLGLFGPTKGTLLAPLGNNDYLIQSPEECSGCYDANLALESNAYKCSDNKCMKAIKVEDVLSKIKEIINV